MTYTPVTWPPGAKRSQAPTHTQPSARAAQQQVKEALAAAAKLTSPLVPAGQAEVLMAVLDQTKQTPKVQAAESVLPGELPPGAKRSAKPPQGPPIERVQASYKQLALAATNLNTASDELGQVVGLLDKALKKLNLGISAWVTVSHGGDSPNGTQWWSRDIGYGKVEGKWGIALRTLEGDDRRPEEDSQEAWLFNEAPRWMRIESVGRIPDLLDRLVKQTEETTQSIRKKTTEASEFVQAIDKLAEESESIELAEPMNWDADAEQK